MTRQKRMIARCSAAEKELLTQVAQLMQRTASDTLRILVSEKAQALGIPHAPLPMDLLLIEDEDELRVGAFYNYEGGAS